MGSSAPTPTSKPATRRRTCCSKPSRLELVVLDRGFDDEAVGASSNSRVVRRRRYVLAVGRPYATDHHSRWCPRPVGTDEHDAWRWPIADRARSERLRGARGRRPIGATEAIGRIRIVGVVGLGTCPLFHRPMGREWVGLTSVVQQEGRRSVAEATSWRPGMVHVRDRRPSRTTARRLAPIHAPPTVALVVPLARTGVIGCISSHRLRPRCSRPKPTPTSGISRCVRACSELRRAASHALTSALRHRGEHASCPVPATPGPARAARTRRPVVDRRPAFRPRLPRPPPRGTGCIGSGRLGAAPRTPARAPPRPESTAVGALPDRKPRWRQHPLRQGAHRADRGAGPAGPALTGRCRTRARCRRRSERRLATRHGADRLGPVDQGCVVDRAQPDSLRAPPVAGVPTNPGRRRGLTADSRGVELEHASGRAGTQRPARPRVAFNRTVGRTVVWRG